MRSIASDRRIFALVALVFGLMVAAVTAIGQTDKGKEMEKKYSETEASNLKKVMDGFGAWKNGTGSPYQLLDESVSWTIVGNSLASKEYTSRKAFIDEVITPFNARMSKPLVPTIRNIYADGDTVIVFFDAEGTAKDGKKYANTYSWFLRLRDGKIDRAVAFFDSVHFNDFWTRVPVAK